MTWPFGSCRFRKSWRCWRGPSGIRIWRCIPQRSPFRFQSVDCLADWGVLPESFDPDTLEFQSGSRAVYVEADSGQSVSMLYLQGENDSRDNFWLVVDEETGLPVWIDCSLRSVKQDLLSSEELGTRFLEGLGVQTQQRGPAMWEVEESGGVVYCALTEASYGRRALWPGECLAFSTAQMMQKRCLYAAILRQAHAILKIPNRNRSHPSVKQDLKWRYER